MSSILTNTSAMTALQTLKTINKDLATIQEQTSTGKKINSAKDNAGIWAVAAVMDADVRGFQAISESLAVGQSMRLSEQRQDYRSLSSCMLTGCARERLTGTE